jgi:hypothetical protein
MSNPVIATTTQRRTIVGTLDEAFTIARTQIQDIDAWAGASISINPVMRDHTTGTFQWEVFISGNPTTLGDAQSTHPPAAPAGTAAGAVPGE